MASLVKSFVFEPISNAVSSVQGILRSRSAKPKPLETTISEFLATSTPPEKPKGSRLARKSAILACEASLDEDSEDCCGFCREGKPHPVALSLVESARRAIIRISRMVFEIDTARSCLTMKGF